MASSPVPGTRSWPRKQPDNLPLVKAHQKGTPVKPGCPFTFELPVMGRRCRPRRSGEGRDPGPPPKPQPSRVITTDNKETNDAEGVKHIPSLKRSEVRPHRAHQSLCGQHSQRACPARTFALNDPTNHCGAESYTLHGAAPESLESEGASKKRASLNSADRHRDCLDW